MSKLTLTVNGTLHELEVPESRTLAQVLRYDLGLTGTKIGCEEAECGACTVIVNGEAIDSCIYPAFKAESATVETIEGLAKDGELHPLQRAFAEHGAVQCGFCTPGLIMTAKRLLDEKPDATHGDVKVALKDTFCRCTGYVAVFNAIDAAAAELRGETAHGFKRPPTVEPLKVIGQPVSGQHVIDKVTGRAKFTDDYIFPDMLYARTLRAAYPHARLLSIDTSAAKALTGVAAVLTHEDVPGDNIHGLVYDDWPALAADKVRYMGDPVAIVAAETQEIADEAIKLIQVEYEPLGVVDNPEYARSPEAPVLHENWPTGNLLKHIKVYHGDIEQGLAEADVIVEREYRTPTTEHAFLEPECSIGVPAGVADHNKLTIYVGSQIPYQDRNQVARAMTMRDEDVRIVGTLIGGGFGGKEDIAGQIHVAMLATATGRPVKMLYTRQESLLFHPKRHATVIRIKTGAKRDGTLTAVRAELYGDGGAYASLSDKVLTRATTHATGPYVVPNTKIDCYAMYTNNPPSGAFRGFGVTQSAFAVEQNMDLLAEALGMDPFELRRKNAQKVGITTATGQLLRESVGLLETIDKVEADMQTHTNDTFRWGWVEGKKAYGWGIACAYKNTGLGGGAPDKSAAEVEVFEDGSAEVRTSAADMGQGLDIVVSQCVAEELGLTWGRVRALLSDTDLTPDGGPTTASRQTFVTGNAARLAATTMREALAQTAAEHMDVPPAQLRFEEGLVRYNGHSVPLGEVVKWMRAEGREPKALYEYWAPRTQPLGTGGDMHFAFSYATQAALVEVDLDTGAVRAVKIISATDVGRAINPKSIQGQIEGGIVMAMGYCLTEQYICEDGVPWSTLLARYKMPSIKHTPEIISHLVEHPSSEGPYGAKGVGEIPSINTTPAICNGIYHATGIRVFSTPVDQDALLRALKSGQKELHTTWSDVK